MDPACWLKKRIQAFKTKCLRKLLCVSYFEHKTSNLVRSKINFLVGPQELLVATVRRWKLSWFGHATCHDGLSKSTLHGTLEGGWHHDQRRKCWMDIKECTSLPMPELLTRAFCRKDWKRISPESSIMSPDDPIGHGTEMNRTANRVYLISSSSACKSLCWCCVTLKPARWNKVHCLLQVLTTAPQLLPQLCPLQPHLASESTLGWVVSKCCVQGSGVMSRRDSQPCRKSRLLWSHQAGQLASWVFLPPHYLPSVRCGWSLEKQLQVMDQGGWGLNFGWFRRKWLSGTAWA